MSDELPRQPIKQATPFQRFTIRLIDGRFVRVPKSDLPSVEPCVDPSALSNQTEIRELFRLVNGEFVRVGSMDASNAEILAAKPPPTPAVPDTPHYPDPTFELSDEHRLPETR